MQTSSISADQLSALAALIDRLPAGAPTPLDPSVTRRFIKRSTAVMATAAQTISCCSTVAPIPRAERRR
jgi:hypothetical protein